MSSLKLLKYVKGGSKPAQITKAAIVVGVCLGSFCGFSQGSKFGRQKKQGEVALQMYPKLQNKLTWQPIKSRYFPFHNILSLYTKHYVWIIPLNNMTAAYQCGIQDSLILLKYNEWDMRTSSIDDLWTVKDGSMQREKEVICLNPNDGSIVEYVLPKDTIGVLLSGTPCKTDLYNSIVESYNQYLNRNE